MNKKYKYARLCWPNGGFAIVKDCRAVYNKKAKQFKVDAVFIFGSKRGYDTSGTKFGFYNVEKVEDLEQDFVVRNFFPGLL